MDSYYLTKLALIILLTSGILISATVQDKILVFELGFEAISGIVKEKSNYNALEYANIVLCQSADYFSSSSLNMESPVIMLSLSYAINNYK